MTDQSTASSPRAWPLFLASLVVLVQELILIRWLPGQVRVLAYFPNLILMSAFLGLGIGCLLSGAQSLLPYWIHAIVVVIVLGSTLSNVIFTQNSPTEHLWLLYHDMPPDSLVIPGIELPIIGFFIVSALTFIPLGQFVATQLRAFQREGAALTGYCWDIAGSLLGVISFGAIGYLGLFPYIWFALLFVLIAPLLWPYHRAKSFVFVTFAILSLFLIYRGERNTYYSPYYAITYAPFASSHVEPTTSFAILTNGSLHQRAQNMSRNLLRDNTIVKTMVEGYHLPYDVTTTMPKKVLIIGAGNGNDVAVALERGAEEVHAVEIDPVIYQIGKEYHPDRPYSSPLVTVSITDARTFLNNSKEHYDLIVFATLDSMTKLSALSSVRLDNFIYTVEALAAARERLAPNGGLVLNFSVSQGFIHDRILHVLTTVFGDEVAFIEKDYGMFNALYLAGPAFIGAERQNPEIRRFHSAPEVLSVAASTIPTDDWPLLYLEKRGISSFYLVIIGSILAISFLGVAFASRAMRGSLLTGKGIDLEMFLFGVGFLLLQARGVTSMSLAWGATWITSSVVFGSILTMILASTLFAKRINIKPEFSLACIILSLGASYFVPADALLAPSIPVRLLLSLVVIGLPVFFAGLCFSSRFATRTRTDLAFGWNLLGAVVGGLLEFTSMAIGFRALLLVAIATYAATLIARLIPRSDS